MSQSNDINFGPVFMRGRKPAPITNKPNPISNNPPGPPQVLLSQSLKSAGDLTSATPKSNQLPPSSAPSPATNITSLPLPKSFSAAVSPGKEIQNRAQSNGTQNAWDATLNHPPEPSTPHISPATDYSRETLLNLYSEQIATKLPPDLEINDPAISLEFIGPPLALVEMTETEKDLFAGPFNSEKRHPVHKTAAHHALQDHSSGVSLSPELSTNHGLPSNKLSVGGPVKLGKHSSAERFNTLGIQGGVLAGVASPSHSNSRRRGDNEPDSSEPQRRFQRSEDTSANAGSWSANLRDRRARDSGPPPDGKWKRGISFEEKIQSQDSSGGHNLKYSVLDKMREKAAANLEMTAKEAHSSPAAATQVDLNSKDGDELSLRASNQSTSQPWESGEDPSTPSRIEEKFTNSSSSKNEATRPTNTLSQLESTAGAISLTGLESSPIESPSNELNPEDIAWQYRDPSGTVQGPFTAFQMQEWYKATFFREDLLVKRVIDAAFETLETLILRVGDRDRPFLARPPPVLPPNLPLPQGHSNNRQLHPSQASPQLPNSNFLDHISTNMPRTDSSSAVGSSLNANSASASNHLGGIPAPDPWNNTAPRSSPLARPGTLPASKLDAGIGWNSSMPTFAQPNTAQNIDYEIRDGIIEFSPNMLNNTVIPNLPNSFMTSDTLRYLHQMQHPALPIAAANGYPFPLPLGQPPNFGPIPPMPPISNGSRIDPILAAQLHSRLMHSPFLFNHPLASGLDGLEPQAERPSQDNFAPSANHLDPWHGPPQPPRDPSTLASDQNHIQSALMTPNHNPSVVPTSADDRRISNPVASADVIPDGGSTGKFTPGLEFQEREVLSAPEQKSTEVKPQQILGTIPPLDSAEFPVAERLAGPSSSSQPVSTAEQQSRVNTAETSVPTTHTASESYPQNRLSSKPSSVTAAPTALSSKPGISTSSDSNQPWQNVTFQPAVSNVTQISASLAHAPSVPKPTGKVIVLSRAQQDEQDRRTASIQKTQLQLKEAQAIERAAREASEAAAAAVTASFTTPAPWSKDEKTSTNMSLTEIQAIEAKQTEKRRLAEKQAAASRAVVERAIAAERASKTAKEALPPTSNWAATASSPVKSSTPGTVWRPKESERAMSVNGPKQSMKQIQEEEARKKSLALQQATKSGGSNVIKPAGGYLGVAASAKPLVGGPWSVVGAKSKVIAPPSSSNPPTSSGNSAIGPGTIRVGVVTGLASKPTPKPPVIIGKTMSKAPQTAPAAIATSTNSSNTIANNPNADGPPPASPEFMKWLREALRGMNNVEDFVKMLLDFPINPDESVLEIVSDSVYAGSATLDGRRFAKEFNARRMADVASRMNKGGPLAATKTGDGSFHAANGIAGTGGANPQSKKAGNSAGLSSANTMADAVKFQPSPKNDGWGFAVVGAKKKKK